MIYISMIGARKNKKSISSKQQYLGAEFEVNNWDLSELVMEKLIPTVGIHPFPLNELMLMTSTIDRFRPQIIFEWGTHIGKSARVFYEVCKALDIKSDIHSIDLPEEVEHVEHPHSERGKLVRGLKHVTLHQGDGVDTAISVLKKLGKKHYSGEGTLFYVDGDHSYESVKRELSKIMKDAPKAGVLLHDTFYQTPESNYNVGPNKAVNECMKLSKNKYRRIDTQTGLPGLTLLYPA